MLWPGVEDELAELMLWCRQHAGRFIELGDALHELPERQEVAWALEHDLQEDLVSAMYDWVGGTWL